ncbi:hypothetical protein AN964_18060 [Heyndrickxia shackletonii]|uniref:DUF3231 family protein n=1 Tax=Heyndrickxia shackletonii TaxID=157838 RepID=A0A0Q3X096_9BACI|nr:DUF3231 family protein [Heyndrickxia shackletonii]KQL55226.1 hypothetical protein AN964_18060 [Heyndrickxia shackletonii]NEY98750.1 DUF3231 family protein [Heyndrickxia shackletonii]
MLMSNSQLSAAEMGKLWASYMGNSMGKCVLSYYLKHVDDQDIKAILEFALNLSTTFAQRIEDIFNQAEFPVPIGYTEDDVNLEAPRLFHDQFYLHYLDYLGKAGMSIYSIAIPLVTRKDIRDFFIDCLRETVILMSGVNELLKAKGVIMNPPPIPTPKKVEYIQKQSFLNGYFGDLRALHGLEIAHLYGNLNNDVTSKALIIGFAQGAQLEKVRKYLERGKKLNQKHIEIMTKKLTDNNLPAPSLLDHLVTTSTITPFSDKLKVAHKIDMFAMKIREYANGASLNGRRDLGVMYAKCQMDVSLYVEDGANIMIEHEWFERPPESVNRNHLHGS